MPKRAANILIGTSREKGRTVDRLYDVEHRVEELEDQLNRANRTIAQLRQKANGGRRNPVSDAEHPGHVLIILGWTYRPMQDKPWVDPISGESMLLPEALSITCQRLTERLSYPSWHQRLLENWLDATP